MPAPCDCCGEHARKLSQQVSVMRKEIKNLRQMLDSAVRAQRKHMTSIQSVVSKTRACEPEKAQAPPSPVSPLAALEQGFIQTVPIGYISSCFSVKNGTPRQPTVCGPSRAELRIQQSVFNNPEHALVGLEQFSHVWIIFLFHKNSHLSHKAKVKPPRLNGQRVGVYSTRSPHRPNALGLTLAKLDKIAGDTVHLSDIDMIAGTPVLDIKPYIPEYDSPLTRTIADADPFESKTSRSATSPTDAKNMANDSESETAAAATFASRLSGDKPNADVPNTSGVQPEDPLSVLEEVKAYVAQSDLCQLSCEGECSVLDPLKSEQPEPTAGQPEPTGEQPSYGEEDYSTIAGWIREPPVASLEVRFTPHAERQLEDFLPTHPSGPLESDRPRFRFLRSSEEAAAAIGGVLSADPRSVYRRTRCKDKLFFFTLDTAHVTCWFGQGFAEVLQVRPAEGRVAST